MDGRIKRKRRPAVIVSNHDDVAADIEDVNEWDRNQRVRNQFDVDIEFWKEAGLDNPSMARCSKINTLQSKELLFKIGKLHEVDLERIIGTIRSYFS